MKRRQGRSRSPSGRSPAGRSPAGDRLALPPDEDVLEHISDRQDHADHEVQVLHRVLPSSAAPSPQAKRAPSRVRSRRNSSSGEELLPAPGDLASSKLKSNSTSTLFVDSTVSAPNMDETLRCVALALHYIIKDGHTVENANLYLSKFDESRFPLTDKRVPRDYYKQIPEDDDIYLFIHRLFHAAALTAECAIITLVYVNRVVAYTDLTIQASTWKRVVLGAILMASKVWDDQAVWNVDFCSILPRIDVEDMNDLERTYLEMLDFNIDVDSSVYAKYYFELRQLAEKTNRTFSLTMLDKDGAKKLEAMSQRTSEVVTQAKIRTSHSLDPHTFTAKAILS